VSAGTKAETQQFIQTLNRFLPFCQKNFSSFPHARTPVTPAARQKIPLAQGPLRRFSSACPQACQAGERLKREISAAALITGICPAVLVCRGISENSGRLRALFSVLTASARPRHEFFSAAL